MISDTIQDHTYLIYTGVYIYIHRHIGFGQHIEIGPGIGIRCAFCVMARAMGVMKCAMKKASFRFRFNYFQFSRKDCLTTRKRFVMFFVGVCQKVLSRTSDGCLTICKNHLALPRSPKRRPSVATPKPKSDRAARTRPKGKPKAKAASASKIKGKRPPRGGPSDLQDQDEHFGDLFDGLIGCVQTGGLDEAESPEGVDASASSSRAAPKPRPRPSGKAKAKKAAKAKAKKALKPKSKAKAKAKSRLRNSKGQQDLTVGPGAAEDEARELHSSGSESRSSTSSDQSSCEESAKESERLVLRLCCLLSLKLILMWRRTRGVGWRAAGC